MVNLHEVRVCGHSDDCIEVDGEIRDEFGAYGDEKPTYLSFSNGAVVSSQRPLPKIRKGLASAGWQRKRCLGGS